MKYFTLSILFAFLFFQAQSQTIANTKWKTFNTSLADTITIEITTDTIYQYIVSDSMLAISLYTQKTDTIELIDVGGSFACVITDTGIYTVAIVGDTMTIDLVFDQCFSRSIVYNGTVLWRVDNTIGISTLDRDLNFKLYPNPSNGFVTIETMD